MKKGVEGILVIVKYLPSATESFIVLVIQSTILCDSERWNLNLLFFVKT